MDDAQVVESHASKRMPDLWVYGAKGKYRKRKSGDPYTCCGHEYEPHLYICIKPLPEWEPKGKETIMSKPINEPRMVQQALVSDEDLSFELAALVPTANGITNAASTFIDRATKLLLSDKIMLTDEQHTAVVTAIAIAQLTVKEGAAISKLLRNPDASAEVIAGLRLTSEDRHDA